MSPSLSALCVGNYKKERWGQVPYQLREERATEGKAKSLKIQRDQKLGTRRAHEFVILQDFLDGGVDSAFPTGLV